ncbi:signal peptidase I [Paenibacillus silvisoli]|uniref:signal peptidase I n=1 Tax=Paenibacillus silvisoli TaxID=3110539 RepID=UPI002803FF7F|nr:signal peptidase I [Paenibacillus silvisoli]
MRKARLLFNIVLVAIVLCTLIASVGAAVTKKPVLLTIIQSDSMVPVWQRGDMVIIENMSKQSEVRPGDIVFFKTKDDNLSSKGWIAHRIISGDPTAGYITKGDANEFTDQVTNQIGPIQREWIAGRAVTMNGKALVIPKIGYLSLWVGKYQSNPYILPIVAVVLAALIGIGELKSGPKRKKKASGLELQFIYMLGGITISMIVGGTMLAASQKVKLDYEVSAMSQVENTEGGGSVLEAGEVITKPLSDLSNTGFFPLIGTITSNDGQIQFSHKQLMLPKGQTANATYTVTAKTPGTYKSEIRVGLFYPLLPGALIYWLAAVNYWLALLTVALLPGLPLMAYPFLDGGMRRRLLKAFRKKKRKLQTTLSFSA